MICGFCEDAHFVFNFAYKYKINHVISVGSRTKQGSKHPFACKESDLSARASLGSNTTPTVPDNTQQCVDIFPLIKMLQHLIFAYCTGLCFDFHQYCAQSTSAFPSSNIIQKYIT